MQNYYNKLLYENIHVLSLCILIIILLWHIHKICDTNSEVYMYKSITKSSSDNTFKILILGATHGNEPVGYHAINKIMSMLNTQQIKLTNLKNYEIYFVPIVNMCGLKTNSRYNMFLFDINRNYNTDSIINYKINHQIKKIINDNNIDLVIDIHEGYSFHNINKNSLGSTISFNFNDDLLKSTIINNINSTIVTNDKKFVFIPSDKMEKDIGTLLEYCTKNKTKHILIEITGQENIQPLSLRIDQCMNILFSILNYYNLIDSHTINKQS